MSAYVVNIDHIDYLVTAVEALGARAHTTLTVEVDPALRGVEQARTEALTKNLYTGGDYWRPAYDTDTLGRMLLAENIRAVAYRYPDDAPGDLPGPIPTPDPAQYQHVGVSWGHITAAGVVNAVRCWRYQTCEIPDHKASLAWAVMGELYDMAVALMVDEANPNTWNWSRPAQ